MRKHIHKIRSTPQIARELFDHPAYPNTGVVNGGPTLDSNPFTQKTRDTADRKLLALDIATKTGWCTRTASGVWNLKPRADESAGMRLIKFKGKVREIVEAEGIKIIVYEMPAIHGKFPNFVGMEMVGILKMVCAEQGIDHKGYPPSVIQKFATGKGKSNKPLMIKQAKALYGVDCETDDEADALHLYHLAIEDLRL